MICRESNTPKQEATSGMTVLVLGAGPAGAAAALALRDAGMNVCVVDSADQPGGRANDFSCKATDRCLRCNLCAAQDTIDRAFAPDSTIELLVATRLLRLDDAPAPHRFQALLDTPTGQVTRNVHALLVATGFTPFDPAIDAAWQYAQAPNIVTGLDLEAMLADGQRTLARPGDNAKPARLAFIQCVGSRSETAHRQPFATDYCSAVCCGYALRSARLIRHLHPDIDISVFYMDIQRFGQDFDEVLDRARSEMHFIKARPWQLTTLDDGSVCVDYEDPTTQTTASETFDMACLSIGMRPNAENLALADTLGLAIRPDGFLRVRSGSVGQTDRPGVYIAGSTTGPMDLAEALAAGQAVAAELIATETPAPTPADPSQALVIGGSVQALQAARAISRRGRSVILTTSAEKLLAETTGAMARFVELLGELDIHLPPFHDQPLASLARAVQDDPNIRVLCNTRPVRCTGQAGEFSVTLSSADGQETISAGAIVLAEPSLSAVDPESLGLEMSRTVTNLLGLMLHLRQGRIPRTVAIVLDQAAQQGRLTTELVFAAARALARRGSHRIRVYAESARVGSTGLEAIYRAARSAGVEVFRPIGPCHLTEQPDGATVAARDVQGGDLDEATFDLLVLGDLVRSEQFDELLTTFHCRPATRQADNVWYLPVKSNRRGIWCLGAEGTNQPPAELAGQAELAAAEVADFLANPQPDDSPAPEVDPDACVACLTCLRLCPHGAITFDAAEQAACISPADCRRCGICAAECPADAIDHPAADQSPSPAEYDPARPITCFVCENSAAQAAEALARLADQPTCPPDVRLIELPCAGRLDPRDILRTLQAGASRVVVLGCHAGACRYFDGPDRAALRLSRLQQQLAEAGLDPDRVQWGTVTAHQPRRLLDLLTASAQPAD